MIKIIRPQLPQQSTLQDIPVTTLFTLNDASYIRINVGATSYDNRKYLNLLTGCITNLHRIEEPRIITIYPNAEIILDPTAEPRT